MSWWKWDMSGPLPGNRGRRQMVIHVDRLVFVISLVVTVALVIRYGFF